MRCWIDISKENLLNNYRIFQILSKNAILIPIVKSNAYGHGLKEVYEILALEAKAKWLGVNYLFEAKSLRNFGFKGRILVLGPIDPKDFVFAAKLNADIIIGDSGLLESWLCMQEPPNIHVKFDTGMSRRGFHPSIAFEISQRLRAKKERVVGVMSHLANVEDVLEHDYARQQIELFKVALESFRLQGFEVIAHIASSASSLILNESIFDMVRVGISMYGLWPSQATRLSYLKIHTTLSDLKPVLKWWTVIDSIKSIAKDQYIGYGCSYRASYEMRVALLPVGYYEGYPRLAGGGGSYVLIRGSRAAILGHICMNMMMVDVTHIPDACAGDVVTLIGQDQREFLDSAQVAKWANTIHYELLTCLNPHIERIVVD